MSQVALRIGGRNYTVACAAGEEAHVSKLGELIDAKLQQLGGNPSPQESQNLLFAALLLADELHEARESLVGARSEREAAQSETEFARRDLAEAQRKLAPVEEERDALRLKLNPLEKEREGLQAAHDSGQHELAELKARVLRLEAEREELASKLRSGTSQALPTGTLDDAELVPALERFADLLENCADKLESKVPTP